MTNQEMIYEGYIAYNGYVFTKNNANLYNSLTQEIMRWGDNVPEYLLEERNRVFKIIISL